MKFKTRIQVVEAIRWRGEENCEEVFDFLGLEHSEDETVHEEIYVPVWPDGTLEVKENLNWDVNNPVVVLEPGDWVVKTSEGKYKAYANEVFEAEFELVVEGFRTELFQNGVHTRVKVTHLETGKSMELSGGHRDAEVLTKAAYEALEAELDQQG